MRYKTSNRNSIKYKPIKTEVEKEIKVTRNSPKKRRHLSVLEPIQEEEDMTDDKEVGIVIT